MQKKGDGATETNECVCFDCQDVKRAALEWAALRCATVLVRLHVTHERDGASAPPDGQDKDVKKVTAASKPSSLWNVKKMNYFKYN